jgi:hypothetical protein
MVCVDPLTQTRAGIERSSEVRSDWLAEQDGFELEVPNLEQPDDSKVF